MTTEQQSGYDMTRDYANLIADEVIALESLLDESADFTCSHCDEERDDCQGQEDSYNAHDYEPTDATAAELLEQMASEAGESVDEYTPSVGDYLNACALEFTRIGECGAGWDWEVTGFKILRTFGGPNCWIVGDGGTSVLIDTYWGGDHASPRVQAPTLIAQLEGL